MKNLKFQIENLGVIKAGEFIQKPLTIFCRPNNSGKTIGNELKLKRDNRDWLISYTNVQVGLPHRHSMGFSLDFPNSKQKPHSIAAQMLTLFEPVTAISDSAP